MSTIAAPETLTPPPAGAAEPRRKVFRHRASRQSARSIHFITMWLLLGFFVVHTAMVNLAGPINGIGSMITGRYAVNRARPATPKTPATPQAGDDGQA